MTRARYFRHLRTLALALAFGLAAVQAGRAQTPPATLATAVHFEFYSFGSPAATGARSVSLITAPFAVRVAPARVLTLAASGAMARGTVAEQGGSTSSLSGLTDTELRATLALEHEGGSVALAAVALVPSGHATLTRTEATVASAVASDLLPFRVSNWGSGGGGALDVSAARALDGGSVGVTASYRVAGQYQPLDDVDAQYRPGSELRMRFGFDRTLESGRSVGLQVSYSRFGEDQWEGSGLLRSGQRVLAFATYATPAGSAVASAYGGVLYRSGGALGDAGLWGGALSGVKAPPSETLLLLGTGARVPWSGSLLLPGLDFRLLRRADGTGQGLLVALGAAADLPLGDGGVRIVPSARARLGKILLAEDTESAIRGFELGLGLAFGGAR